MQNAVRAVSVQWAVCNGWSVPCVVCDLYIGRPVQCTVCAVRSADVECGWAGRELGGEVGRRMGVAGVGGAPPLKLSKPPGALKILGGEKLPPID